MSEFPASPVAAWVQTFLYAFVSVIGAISGGIAVAVRHSKRLDALAARLDSQELRLQQYTDRALAISREELFRQIDTEATKAESRLEKAVDRIGRTEQDIAVLKERQVLQTTLAGLLADIKKGTSVADR